MAAKKVKQQVTPYQATPVSGKIVRNLAKAQPVIDFTNEQERKAAVSKVIKDYADLLRQRTATHMGYPYNLAFEYGDLDCLLKYCINNLGTRDSSLLRFSTKPAALAAPPLRARPRAKRRAAPHLPFPQGQLGWLDFTHSPSHSLTPRLAPPRLASFVLLGARNPPTPGDPWIESNYGVHSRQFELGVLNWFAQLWEVDQKDYWGYITNCGTEGNLHGILVGRENLPEGILYS